MNNPITVYSYISAWFSSPASDSNNFVTTLSDYLFEDSHSVAFLDMSSDAMQWAGIMKGDLLIVDMSMVPKIEDIVVWVVDGEHKVRYLQRDNKWKPYLVSSEQDCIYPSSELRIIWVITWVVRRYKRC